MSRRKPSDRPAGRPTIYCEALAATICNRLAGKESLRHICSEEGMPATQTIFEWIRKYDSFADQYARARENQAEAYVDEIVEISDTEEDPQRARVRIDARKWHASKLVPKKYGDKITQEVTGIDGTPLVPVLNMTVLAPEKK